MRLELRPSSMMSRPSAPATWAWRLAFEVEGHLRSRHHDLATLLEVLRVPRRDLPHRPPVLHLHAPEVLYPLRHLRQEVDAEREQRVDAPGRDGAGDQVGDAPHGDGHHQEQRGAEPCPSHRNPCRRVRADSYHGVPGV